MRNLPVYANSFKIKLFPAVCVNSDFSGSSAGVSESKIWSLNQMKDASEASLNIILEIQK